MTSSPVPAISSETDSPAPSPSPSNVSLSKDFQDNMMDVGSTSGDSGVETNSDIGSSSELASDAPVDLVTKKSRDEVSPSTNDEMDVLEPEAPSAFIPMTKLS